MDCLFKVGKMDLFEFVELSKHFEIYKNLLSKNQRELLDDYLIKNLSISEIAENKELSRQAVFKSLQAGIEKLKSYEKKLGAVKKQDKISVLLQEIDALISQNGNQTKIKSLLTKIKEGL